MPTYQGTCACQNCRATVNVFTNRRDLAYYKCGPCGVKVEHFVMRESQKFLATITPHRYPDEVPENSREIPENAAPEPAPAPRKKAGFFDGVLG